MKLKKYKHKKSMVVFFVVILLFSYMPIIRAVDEIEKNEETVPDFLEIGDLLYMDYKSNSRLLRQVGRMNDHIAMYIGDNKFIHSIPSLGVNIKDYNYFLDKFRYRVFGYVTTADNDQKSNAVLWAESKVGCKYQIFPQYFEKGSDNKWYNSELIWAAYYNQGIDIDQNSFNDPKSVSVQEIIDDFDTETYIVYPVPEYVKKGDIVNMDLKSTTLLNDMLWCIPGYSNDHTAIYLGHEYRDGSYFIHASPIGVINVSFEFFHLSFENFTFHYVHNANKTQVENAVKWCVDQLGAEYQYFYIEKIYWGALEWGKKCADINDPNVKTSNRLYCSELVWAAYYNQGIDIDQNGWGEIYPEPPGAIPKILRKIWYFIEGIFFEPFPYVTIFDITDCKNTTQRLP